jgi:hypothetical protein
MLCGKIDRKTCGVIGGRLPVYVQTVLLPFESKIVFDGLLLSSPVDLGEEVRRALKECLQYVKNTTGIITTLEADASPEPRRRKR